MGPRYHINASPAQVAYIKSLGGVGLNPYLSTAEAALIATNLAYSRAGRALSPTTPQGAIEKGRV